MVARAGDEGSAVKANTVLVRTVFRGETVVRTSATRCQYISIVIFPQISEINNFRLQHFVSNKERLHKYLITHYCQRGGPVKT